MGYNSAGDSFLFLFFLFLNVWWYNIMLNNRIYFYLSSSIFAICTLFSVLIISLYNITNTNVLKYVCINIFTITICRFSAHCPFEKACEILNSLNRHSLQVSIQYLSWVINFCSNLNIAIRVCRYLNLSWFVLIISTNLQSLEPNFFLHFIK